MTAVLSAGCGASTSAANQGQLCEEAHSHHEGIGQGESQQLGSPIVIDHRELQSFQNNGNTLSGIATPSQGARSFEVWRTSVAPGSRTPPHVHESEEVFVFLKGKGRATIGELTVDFEAPATIIAPAGVEHQFFNTGDQPTDAIVVVGVGSTIYDSQGAAMDLPWRK